MMTEDEVKRAIKRYLLGRGFANVRARFGTAKGIDVEGVDPSSGKRLAVECKGETNAVNQWDTAWRNAAQAMFYALRATERRANSDAIALAFPKTQDYRRRMKGLRKFCARQRITVFWVGKRGQVVPW